MTAAPCWTAPSTGTLKMTPRELGGDVQQGYFEEIPGSGEQRVFRLRWQPRDPLSESDKQRAAFVRYLITMGRLSEQVQSSHT